MNKLAILTTVAFLGSLGAASAQTTDWTGTSTPAPVAKQTTTVKHPEHLKAHHKVHKNHPLKGDFPKGNHSVSEEQ
jgi:hypothetical protein